MIGKKSNSLAILVSRDAMQRRTERLIILHFLWSSAMLCICKSAGTSRESKGMQCIGLFHPDCLHTIMFLRCATACARLGKAERTLAGGEQVPVA